MSVSFIFASFFLAILVASEIERIDFSEVRTCTTNSDCPSSKYYGSLICSEGICQNCVSNDECEWHLHTCQTKFVDETGETVGFCTMKEAWPPTLREIIATILIVIFGSFAHAGGIIGAIWYPILILVAGYSTKYASPFSIMIGFGGAFTGFLVVMWEKHPDYPKVNRPRINYNLAALLEPILLAGGTVGVIFNYLVPQVVTLWLMVVIFILFSGRIMKYGVQQALEYYRGVEPTTCSSCISSSRNEIKSDNEDESTEMSSILSSDVSTSINTSSEDEEEVEGGDSLSSLDSSALIESTDEDKTEISDDDVDTTPVSLIKWVKWYESLQIQPFQMLFLLFNFLFVFFMTLLRGSRSRKSIIGIEVCGDTYYYYWMLTLGSVPVLISFSYTVGLILHLLAKWKQKYPSHFPQNIKGDLIWNFRNTFFVPLMFFSAGFITGFLGICSCLVMSPLFIELGVLGEVSCSTSVLMILITNIGSVIQYLMMGRLRLDYSLWFGVVGFLTALLGRFVVKVLVNKFKMRFILTFVVALTIGLGSLLIFGNGVYDVLMDMKVENYDKFWFSWIC